MNKEITLYEKLLSAKMIFDQIVFYAKNEVEQNKKTLTEGLEKSCMFHKARFKENTNLSPDILKVFIEIINEISKNISVEADLNFWGKIKEKDLSHVYALTSIYLDNNHICTEKEEERKVQLSKVKIEIENEIEGYLKMSNELRAKLDELAKLEKKYNIRGISIKVKDGETVSTEESIDYVLAFIKQAVETLEKK